MTYTQDKSLHRGWMLFGAALLTLLMLALGANPARAADAPVAAQSAPVLGQ